MEKTTIATKLTVAGMGLNKDVLKALVATLKEGEAKPIALIFGKTSKYETKQSKLDPTRNDIAFKGEFEGHNLLDGTIHNAPKAYLPGAAEGATVAAVDGLGEGEAVTFGCEIGVKKADNAIGYQFTVAVPKQPQAQDPLAELRAAMTAEAPKAIAAPKAEKKA